MMVVKTITDLERIGDEAAKIARMTQLIYEADRPFVPRTNEVRHMADVALAMLRNALDSFARLDLTIAAKVVRQDDRVDDAFRGILRQLITFMMEDPRHLACDRNPVHRQGHQRIGDHAKYVRGSRLHGGTSIPGRMRSSARRFAP